MNRIAAVIGIIVILFGVYIGVRYVSTMIHYACLNPVEDCPPPFFGLAQIGYYGTGGSLIPVFDSKFEHLQREPLKQQ
jgi:hypothetical protein